MLSLVDAFTWPALVVNNAGKVTYVNAALAARGIRLSEQKDRQLAALLPEHYDALQSKVPWLVQQEADVVTQVDGRPLHERLFVLRFDTGACIVFVDQNRLQELEVSRAQTVRLASLGFLLASVSHEISNPLSAINSVVQILQSKRGVSADVRQKGTSLIAENVRRMLLITRKLTSFARVDDVVRREFAVDGAIDEAILQLNYDSLGETVQLDHQRAPDAIVAGYQDQLQQVFFNLLLNAAQVMKGRGTITVATRHVEPDQVEIAVSDTGPGIPSLNLARVFEPFFTTKPRGDGIGLGLAISNEIVQEHGGSLTARNNMFGGAVFVVLLPLASKPRKEGS